MKIGDKGGQLLFVFLKALLMLIDVCSRNQKYNYCIRQLLSVFRLNANKVRQIFVLKTSSFIRDLTGISSILFG